MAQLAGYKKERPLVLGEHTAVSIARSSGKWKEIRNLIKGNEAGESFYENEGMLPPNLIVVGDRRRVNAASKLLRSFIPLHDVMEKKLGPHGAGRVNIALGVYEHNGRPVPLTILETQMGMSGQDINAWEVLVNSREDGYMVDGIAIPSRGLNVIRAGTCGGIIISEPGKGQIEPPLIEIGDMIIAVGSIADGAVVRQRSGCWTPFDQEQMKLFREFWAKEGLDFTDDGLWPQMRASPQVTGALLNSCTEFGLFTHLGGNISKESLYMEGNEERLKAMRKMLIRFCGKNYPILSTEMEHFGLAFLAHELTKAGILTTNGLISTVVGTVPGGSFAMPGSEEEKLANRNQERMLEAVMLSLWKLTYES